MSFFTARPQRLFTPLCIAMAVGAVVGSLGWWLYAGLPPEPGESWSDHLMTLVALMVPVSMVCAATLLLYAWPALLVLRSVGWAGPGSALLLALAPAALIALAPNLRPLALLVGGFGLASGVVFALLAYRPPKTRGQA